MKIKNPHITRPMTFHKGNCGRLGIIAGSAHYTGAVILATQAAFRCGIGSVIVFSIKSVTSIIQTTCPEAIAITISNDTHLSHNNWAHLLNKIREHRIEGLIIGPGLGTHPDTKGLVNLILSEQWQTPLPCVIDADAIHALKKETLSQLNHISSILTPHQGEFEKLIQEKITNKHHQLQTITNNNTHVIVLKGAPTLVAQQHSKTYKNPSGNPGMAVAGMGDVLSGCIGALMLQRLSTFEASCIGVYIHGKAGDLAFKKYHIGLTPSDVICYLPEALADFVTITPKIN